MKRFIKLKLLKFYSISTQLNSTQRKIHKLFIQVILGKHDFLQMATQNRGFVSVSTKQQETQNLSGIFDLELCENELLKNNDKKYGIHINHKNNKITKINDTEAVQMYGKKKYGNMKVLNNNTQSILNVILQTQIKQSMYGVMLIGVTESNFNVCKNAYIYKSEGIDF